MLQRAVVALFEIAADAVVDGHIGKLQALLDEHPSLVHERSPREHHSTLLHYVSANGIEDVRQKTPPNIVDITRLLLDAGADVNAESDAYGGRSTVLDLTATSIHPERAGVQVALLTLLLERGAFIDGVRGDSIVNGCLANGRGIAAEFLASRGAKLDFEGAAGVGRLDLMRNRLSSATRRQMLAGFGRACQFGRTEVVDFLLDNGVQPDAILPQHGETGLHWAAHEGYAQIVSRLLERGAPIVALDKSFEGTPLDWALHGWVDARPQPTAMRDHYQAVALLVKAGSKLDPRWYGDQSELLTRARADERMREALAGKLSI